MANKENRYAVVLGHFVPTAPAGLEVVDRPEVHSSLLALGRPAHRTGLFVVAEPVSATSPTVLDQQQS